LTTRAAEPQNRRVPDDAASFRAAPAEAYDAHIGRYGAALGTGLLDAAGVFGGGRALDVGCGPGALTAALAERLGAENVAAVDQSDPFAAACRVRVPGADVRVADALALPFDDGTFDAVLSQLVVNFLPDPARGVAEMVRVARPGGTVAACVWDYADGMTLLRVFWDAAIALDPDGAAPLDEGVRMPHCSEAGLRALWEGAGIADVRAGALGVRAGYASFEDLWAPIARGVGPSGAYAGGLAPDHRDAFRDEFARRLGAGDAPFDLSARAWWVAGRTVLPPG
jgi:SAM-dependent methyltransferase